MKKISILVCLLTGIVLYAYAIPTKIVIRVKAKDAKFIGTGIGGAYIIVKNNLTGETLAKGITTGSSGSTELIMQTPVKRWQSLTDDKTAKFEAVIDIADPLFIDIEAVAPVNRKNASIRGSTQLWLVPGKHITGDGIVLELPGFILDILSPSTHEFIPLNSLKDQTLQFKASLTLLCGCTITKGGVWNSDDIEVAAYIKKEGVKIKETPLTLTDKANIFSGKVKIEEKGSYEITIYAYDIKTNNTGVDHINFVIQ